LAKCETGVFTLVSSEVLTNETDRNPFPQKKIFVESVLANSALFIVLDAKIENRAIKLEVRGFKAYDALPIAAAESAVADYFCTCDDRLLQKAQSETDLLVKVRSPLSLAQEIFS